jgi:hypothetical protein
MARKVDADKHFKEQQRAYARGGHDRMFNQQNADPRVRGGITGKPNSSGGPGKQFPRGGGKDHIFGGHAAPAKPGVTATTRQPERSRTRNYGK